MNRKMYEQSVKEYEEYLEDERKLWEKKKQCKWQIKKDLMDQIQCRKNLIVSILGILHTLGPSLCVQFQPDNVLLKIAIVKYSAFCALFTSNTFLLLNCKVSTI